MKTQLHARCAKADFKAIFEKKGYAFFTKGAYNLNIIGVRSNNKNSITDKYDDVFVVDYNTEVGHKRFITSCTTEPGLFYMKQPTNIKGCAILVPGQYRGAYKKGLHKGAYKALCQVKPVKVYRDKNKDDIYDMEPSTIDEGLFGINIHRANEKSTISSINKYSAGCQVINDPADFRTFMRLIDKGIEKFGNSFTYTLINEEDLE